MVELCSGTAPSNFLNWDQLRDLLDQHRASGGTRVCFAGKAEPLLHPRAWEALDLSLANGFFTSLHSSLELSLGATAQRIIDLGVHRLVVPLPEANCEIPEHLLELCRLRSDRPVLRLQWQVTDSNAADFDSLLEAARASAVDELELFTSGDEALSADTVSALLPRTRRLRLNAPWRRPRLVDGESLISALTALAPSVGTLPVVESEAANAARKEQRDEPGEAKPRTRRGLSFPTDKPAISVVVPTHAGSAQWLPECLEAIAELRGPVPEVLLVIDGPAPEIKSLIRELLPAARQLQLPRNRGFAEAASAGLRTARGELVALLNDDAVPDPDWLEAITSAAARHLDAGFFASRVLQHGAPQLIDSAGHGLCRWGEAFHIGADAEDGPRFDLERWVFGAPACAAVYRRALIEDCGGFDTAMEAYLEDVDLSLRAQLLGFPCLYVADARVRHRGSSSYGFGNGSSRARQLAARNRIRLLLRSMPASTLRAAGPAAAVSIAAELARSLLRGDAPLATAVGTIEGLGAAGETISERPLAQGRRRVDDRWMRAVLRNSEQRLCELAEVPGAGHLRRQRATLARSLTALVDLHEGWFSADGSNSGA